MHLVVPGRILHVDQEAAAASPSGTSPGTSNDHTYHLRVREMVHANVRSDHGNMDDLSTPREVAPKICVSDMHSEPSSREAVVEHGARMFAVPRLDLVVNSDSAEKSEPEYHPSHLVVGKNVGFRHLTPESEKRHDGRGAWMWISRSMLQFRIWRPRHYLLASN